jgi:hypothetical protein
MIDAFDAFDDGPTVAPSPREYEVLTEGVHELEIVAASVGDVPWKGSTANLNGECLKLRLSAGRGVSYVFADLPRHRQFLFKALAMSLGLEPGPDGKVSLGTPEGLVGRRVRVEIGHYTTRKGETRANVRRWLPAAGTQTTGNTTLAAPQARTTPRAAPCRTQATKAAAAFRATADDDDIPF